MACLSESVRFGCNLSIEDLDRTGISTCPCGAVRHRHPRAPSDLLLERTVCMMLPKAMYKGGCWLTADEVKANLTADEVKEKRCVCNHTSEEHFPRFARAELQDFIRRSYTSTSVRTPDSNPVAPATQTPKSTAASGEKLQGNKSAAGPSGERSQDRIQGLPVETPAEPHAEAVRKTGESKTLR